MESEHMTGQVIRQLELGVRRVDIFPPACRAGLALGPRYGVRRDAQDFIFGPNARTFVCFGLDRRQVPLVDVMRWNGSALLVAGLPTRQAETFANIIAAFAPIVARVAVNQKSVRRVGSSRTASERSRGEWPGPGHEIVSRPATSPPSLRAISRTFMASPGRRCFCADGRGAAAAARAAQRTEAQAGGRGSRNSQACAERLGRAPLRGGHPSKNSKLRLTEAA